MIYIYSCVHVCFITCPFFTGSCILDLTEYILGGFSETISVHHEDCTGVYRTTEVVKHGQMFYFPNAVLNENKGFTIYLQCLS